jgi:hypothetical protein
MSEDSKVTQTSGQGVSTRLHPLGFSALSLPFSSPAINDDRTFIKEEVINNLPSASFRSTRIREISLGRHSSPIGILDLRPNLSKTFDILTHGIPKFSGKQKDWKSFSQNIIFALTHLGLVSLVQGLFRLIQVEDLSLAQSGTYDENNKLMVYLLDNQVPLWELYSLLMFSFFRNMIDHDVGLIAIANTGVSRPYDAYEFFGSWRNLKAHFDRGSLIDVSHSIKKWMAVEQGSSPFTSFYGIFDAQLNEINCISPGAISDNLAISQLMSAMSSNTVKIALSTFSANTMAAGERISYLEAVAYVTSFVASAAMLGIMHDQPTTSRALAIKEPSSYPVVKSNPSEYHSALPNSTGYINRREIKCWNCSQNHHMTRCPHEECFVCPSKDHCGRNCPKLKAKLEDVHTRIISRGFSPAPISSTGQSFLTSHLAILDTGASQTFVCNRDLITEELPASRTIVVANGQHLKSESSGVLVSHPNLKAEFVPGLDETLLSLGEISDEGHIFVGDSREITVIEGSDAVRSVINNLRQEAKEKDLITMYGKRTGSLYYTDLTNYDKNTKSSKTSIQHPSQRMTALSVNGTHGLHFNHERDIVLYYHDLLGHMGLESMIHLVRNQSIKGMHPNLTEKLVRRYYPRQCVPCAKGSMSRKPVSKNKYNNKKVVNIGDSVEVDIMFGNKNGIGEGEGGQACSGYELVFVAVDRASRFTIAYLLKDASDLQNVLEFLRRRFLSDGHKLTHLRFDDQFVTKEIKEFLLTNGISYDVVPPYEHSLLGLVERTNRSLEEKVIKVMDKVKDKRLWGLAIADCVLKMNLSPRAAIGFNNPYEKWYKNKFDMSEHPLLPFGAKVMAHIPVVNQRVLGPKAESTIAVGTQENAIDTVKLWQSKSQKIWNRRTFRLAEDDYYDIIPPLVVETSAEETELSIPDNFSSNIDHNIIGDKSFDDEDNQLPKQILRRSTRLQSNSGNKGGKLLSAVVENPLIKPRIPRNVAEARFDNLNSEAWIEAMHQEVSSLFDQNTFEFIAFIPPNHQTVPSMFVFDVRYNSDGTIKKFKCRLVARGDQQDSSTFGDTYADTIASRSINITYERNKL